MFNVGGPEIMVVLLVALIVLGPEQLPKAMRTFGNVMAQIRKVSNGFQDEMRSAMNTLDTTASVKGSNPSPSGSSGTPSSDTGTTEVVARNDGPGGSAGHVSNGVADGLIPSQAPVVDPVSDRPGSSSADRAAG